MAEMIAICGVKNSGKTTLINRIVSELTAEGMKVAVIKHDGHDFDCDVPGTDSYSFVEAGAYGTAVFSDRRMFIQKIGTGETEKELTAAFPEADIIILEGHKDADHPKIEVVRKGNSDTARSNPEGRFLIVSDLERDQIKGKGSEPVLSPADIEGIISVIRKELKTNVCGSLVSAGECPSQDEWLLEALEDPSSGNTGMYLTHTGIVRRTSRSKVRDGDQDSRPVTGMNFSYDEIKVRKAIAETFDMPGITYIRVWLNRGRLAAGEKVMQIMIGGDIRPHVIDGLQSLVGRIKNECASEEEIY